ncbi:MAG: hypothetical protein A3D92_22375, partial [Bacteroidetes bacterium RIFCSPHIGHO2_02_FULL_44_7]
AVFLPPNFDFYSEYSKKVRNFLNQVAPVVEQASIDEFYMDLTGCGRLYPDLTAFASLVKHYLRTELKLPSTIAIASNKLVSKIAVNEAKPDGLIQVEWGAEADFLRLLPVRAMPGIGKATEREMNRLGLKTLRDIQTASESLLQSQFGAWGLEFKKRAHGIDSSPVVSWEDPKSIGRETTFERDVGEPAYLLSVLSSFVEECAAELRQYGFQARTVTVKFRLPDFTTFERSKTVEATCYEREIYQTAEKLFSINWKAGMKLRLLGMSVSNFLRSHQTQTLFPDPEHEKLEKLSKQIDAIRARFGLGAIHIGSSLRAYDP